mmetsp:Transcript_4722/g.7318  ORF Transcript_4722/g.7318 Transcript_4722/m.7318 type:complete len:121 (+) Transcript_4722:1326-1688(+)
MIPQEKCAACQQRETIQHIHSCQDQKTIEYCYKVLSSLADKMKTLKTSPSIVSAIMEGVQSVWKETPHISSAGRLPGIQDAIASQNKIGWWALICGRWSSRWAKAQTLYFKAIKSPRSSK